MTIIAENPFRLLFPNPGFIESAIMNRLGVIPENKELIIHSVERVI